MIYQDCLQFIESTLENKIFEKTKMINIYTDSKYVMNILSMSGYPKSNYVYKLINQINYLAWKLKKYNVCIRLIKIPSHKGIFGNQVADNLAKQAAAIAYNCKYRLDDKIYYNTYWNPVIVDISKDLILYRKYVKYKRKNYWLNKNTNWMNYQLNSNFYTGNMIFHKYIVSHCNGSYSVRNKSKILKNENKYLKRYESEIINKLRTEYINLNEYKLFRFNENDGNCKYCNVPETVQHFLIDCSGNTNNRNNNKHKDSDMNFNMCRKILRKSARKISCYMKNEANFNVVNLLFPNIWQLDPSKTDPHYKRKIQNNMNRSILILKAVVKYVLETKRFVNEQYGY